MDFSKITAKPVSKKPVEPIELFHTLKVSDASINDLWLGQGDALREWHDVRNEVDIGVILNTGAGKTLVGLLIAQSLVNETKERVLYACSSIQLVEQTAEKAGGYGLAVTTYIGGVFSNDLFHQGVAPCITTYQALFNGKSIFFKEDVTAVIFDDSHAAEHLLRDQFSLRVSRDEFPASYREIIELFRPYFQGIGKAGTYAELDRGDSSKAILVPPFQIRAQQHELIRILNEANFAGTKSTTFSWAHLKDHIDLSCLLLSAKELTFTPPFIPVKELPYFQSGVRRVYMSATLGARDAFARSFGRVPTTLVSPETPAGACERMILIPARVSDDDESCVKSVLAEQKALFLVPSYGRANRWSDFAKLPEKARVTEAVNEFKDASSPAKLLLAARYDGVDLPGDTCRIMVIDDLPMGVGPLEQFMWEQLRLSNSLQNVIASRTVQSFGRISRGLSDHGVVFLTGKRLISWLLTPANLRCLPEFLQNQIQLGYQLSEQATVEADLSEALSKCLDRDMEWLEAYSNYMNEAEGETEWINEELLTEIAVAESEFASRMWRREFKNAAKVLTDTLERSFELSQSTGGWHSLWLGYVLEIIGDQENAVENYRRAHGVQRNIPPYPREQEISAEDISEQLVEVERQFITSSGSTVQPPKNISAKISHLDGSGSVPQTEESLRALGELLGIRATRPEKEFGTGPDVLWIGENGFALCIEAKTHKKDESKYKKDEIGQLLDHCQWIHNNEDVTDILPVFIGPQTSATGSANPPETIEVVALEEFRKLGDKIISAFNDIASQSLPISIRNTTQEIFSERGLLWPEVLEQLERKRLVEM